MERKIKIAYIGGGSKLWARTFMSDLAVAENLSGEIALYDIDMKAAERNAKIGGYRAARYGLRVHISRNNGGDTYSGEYIYLFQQKNKALCL